MSTELCVLLVDDHLIVREGVSVILNRRFNRIKVYQAENFTEVILNLKQRAFDLILLDINIPDGNSVDMISKISAAQKDAKILIFSSYEEENYGLRYISSGADGYLNKLCSEEELITAIQLILKTGKYISSKLREKIVNNVIYKKSINPLDTLSSREMEVAKLLVHGDGNLEISHKLSIQTSTISTFKKRIFEKLEINNVLGLAQIFNLYQE